MSFLRNQQPPRYIEKWSSFQTVEKMLEEVVKRCLNNPRLGKLLYYTDPHALSLPQLTQEQMMGLVGTGIKIVPKIDINPDAKPYIIVSLNKFLPTDSPVFRKSTVTIDIICNFNHWSLTDFKLRPYEIAGEIDGMINNFHFSMGGLATFVGAEQVVLGEGTGGCSLYYLIDYETLPNLAPQE